MKSAKPKTPPRVTVRSTAAASTAARQSLQNTLTNLQAQANFVASKGLTNLVDIQKYNSILNQIFQIQQQLALGH